MNSKIRIIFLFIYLFISFRITAQYDEYSIKAVYLEKFTHYIEWPEDSSEVFTIATIGSNPLKEKAELLFKERKIKSRPVLFIEVAPNSLNDEINILFISKDQKNSLRNILKKISDKPILTIADTDGFIEEGVHINFFLEDNKVFFEINEEALKRSGIRARYQLLRLAKNFGREE